MNRFVIILLLNQLIISVIIAQDYDHHIRAFDYIKNGDYNKAVVELKLQIENNKNEKSLLELAKIYYNNKEYKLAIDYANEAEKIKKGSGSYFLSRCYALLDNNKKALEYLEQSLKLRDKILMYDLYDDHAFNDLHYNEEWIELVENKIYSEIDKKLYEIEVIFNKEKPYEAIDQVNDILKVEKNNHAAYALRSEIYLSIGNVDNAMDDINKAIENRSSNIEYVRYRAELFFADRDFANAAVDYAKILRYEPWDIDYEFKLAICYNNSGNPTKAKSAIDHYLIYRSDDLEALNIKGKAYFIEGKYISALKIFNRLLEKDKSKPEYFINRGDTYTQTKTYKYALADYAMALDLDPTNGETYLKKGNVRFIISDHEGACRDWKKAAKYGNKAAVSKVLNHCQ